MKKFIYFKSLLFLVAFSSSAATAGSFIELSAGLIKIDTPAASTQPSVADFRLGYEISQHQLELAFMSSIKEDKLNQLTTDVPSVVSILYRYIVYPRDRLKIHYILGASQVKVESSITGITESSDRFDGVSFGLGLEEAFSFNRNLKFKFDWIQLYRGDQINITVKSLGLRYEF